MTTTFRQQISTDPKVFGGKPHIHGRRISVNQIVVWHELLGKNADEIAHELDLSLSEIYSALAFYHQNRAEVDAAIHSDENFVLLMKGKIPSKIRTENAK